MLILFMIAQTLNLSPEPEGKIVRYNANKYGHFMYTATGEAYHWNAHGKLLHKIERDNKQTWAMHPIPGGYVVTWIAPADRAYGLDVTDPFQKTVQSFETLSWWFLEIKGQLYKSSDTWAPGKNQLIPLSSRRGRLFSSKADEWFDPEPLNMTMDADYKGLWPVETDEGVNFVTPLDPIIFIFANRKFEGTKKIPVPWIEYPGRWKRDVPLGTHLERFTRIVYYGDSRNGEFVAVQTPDRKTTIYWFREMEITKRTTIDGWYKSGQIVGGSDGARVYVYDPDTRLIKVF
ncbi:MAG: hypothetical protein QNK37_29580 [Acidobacteriota bacterium]|nr:hypothetical protein [Acidobacteriota bacterium]